MKAFWLNGNKQTDIRLTMQKFTAFNLEDFVAGKSHSWTFWDCAPSEFPWTYSKDEYAYVLAGQFYVTYEGERASLVSARWILPSRCLAAL